PTDWLCADANGRGAGDRGGNRQPVGGRYAGLPSRTLDLSLDQPPAASDGSRRERSHAHRNERALRGRQATHDRQELVRAGPVDLGEQRLAGRRDLERALTPVGDLFVAADVAELLQAAGKPAGGRWRPADLLGQI